MFGVLDSSVYPALLEETDDGLVVEVELGVDILGQRLAATLTGTLQPQCPLIRSPICLLSISLSIKQKQHSTAEGNKPRTTAVKIIFNRFTLTSFTIIHFNVLKLLLSLKNFGQQRSGRVLQPAVCLQYSDTFLLQCSGFRCFLITCVFTL